MSSSSTPPARALVTGATGFIGGRLVRRLLDDGWNVHCLVRAHSNTDALDPRAKVHRLGEPGKGAGVAAIAKALAAAEPDIVFHLASLYLTSHSHDDVEPLVASNLLFPAMLAEAMNMVGIRSMVSTGTAWQHFRTDTPGAYNPVNLYAATKQSAQDLLRYYHDACGLSLVTLELFDTYGAEDPRRKLVQLLVDAAVSGEKLGMSPGEQIIDLTHVDDVVDAFLVAAKRIFDHDGPLDERYLVSGARLKVRELVTLVADTLGRSVSVELGARPYRPREVMEPVMPAANERLPGWAPKRDLVEHLPDLIRSD